MESSAGIKTLVPGAMAGYPWRMRSLHRIAASGAAALVVWLFPAWASALTSPLPGAVALPSGAVIHLPFEPGASVHVSSGYSPSGGSSLHADTNATTKANDYYALDFILNGVPNAGLGEPVLTIAPGTVVKAGWATQGWANYGLRVIVRHDFGDGHVYHSIYCHLNAISVDEGDQVGAGAVLGELGDSCDGDNQQLSCPWFGPHLHFALHRDSLIGGSGTGGSYGGNAVVPEPFDGYEDLKAGLDLISANSTGPTPPCQLIPPAGGILDDLGPCFRKFGTASYWKEDTAGHDGHLFWTIATADGQPDNWGRWSVELEAGGSYDLRVHIDNTVAMSTQAAYQIRHGGDEDVVTIDQSATMGWKSLGVFDFASGGDQWVRLDDNTGEPLSANRKLVFDAIQLTPTAGQDAGPAVEAGVEAGPDAPGPDGSAADAPVSDAGASSDGDVPAVDAGSNAPGGAQADEADGCACRAGSDSSPNPLWGVFFFVFVVVRRHRRRLHRDSQLPTLQ